MTVVPVFRRVCPPRFVAREPVVKRRQRHKRYDGVWSRQAASFLKSHPFCGECAHQGRDTLAELVDHKYPVRDGGAMYDRSNWWPLCRSHHDSWKRKFEAYCRARGLLGRMPEWCADPAKRPERFRYFPV